MLDAGEYIIMSDDPPPPYTAVGKTKTNPIILAGQLPGRVSYYSHLAQPIPPHLIPAYPPAPPGYVAAVVYYPAPPNSVDGAVLLQPQQQVIASQQSAPSNDAAGATPSQLTEACRILCCMCLCSSCLCVLISVM